MPYFRKKPVVIEAIQFTGDNLYEVGEFIGGFEDEAEPGAIGDCVLIDTMEGVMRADIGDWIIRGVKGEHYPCKPDIFAATYEPAHESTAKEDK